MGHCVRGWGADSQDISLAEQEVSEDDGRAALTLWCRSDPLPLFVHCNLSIVSATRLPIDVMGEEWSFLVISVWTVRIGISAGFELTVPNSSAPKHTASSF